MLCFEKLSKDVQHRDNFDKVMKFAGKSIEKNPKAKMMGANNMETFKWLWKKYTGQPFDPTTIKIRDYDVRIFEQGIKEWNKGLMKESGFFARNFKLPKVLTRGIKGGEDFIGQLEEAISYNQRQLKEGAIHINEMMGGLYDMFLKDKDSPIIGENAPKSYNTNDKMFQTKKQYDHFQKLEKRLLQASTPKQIKDARDEVIKFIGKKGPNGPVGGQIVRRFQDILGGLIPYKDLTAVERKISHHWDILRLDSMKNLLNGAISARRTLETLHESTGKNDLLKSLDVLNEQIEGLLISGEKTAEMVTNDYQQKEGVYIPTETNQFQIYNPRTKSYRPYKMRNVNTGEEAIGIKKYFPKYVIELSEVMNNIVEYAKDTTGKKAWDGMTPEQIRAQVVKEINPQAISDRLKHAGETEHLHSLDPNYYLNKYLHDVASFNLRSRINHAYSEATSVIINNIRKNNTRSDNTTYRWDTLAEKGGDVGQYSQYLVNLLTEIKDSALVSNAKSSTVMDEAVRAINAFEYISKLGWSVKGGLKNRTQGIFNWIYYGQRGYKRAKDFKNTSNRIGDAKSDKDLTNESMIRRQLKRFGLMIGIKAEAANVAAATAGSIDVSLIPEGFDVNDRGRLILLDKKSKAKKVADKMAWAADKVSGPMKWAENANRIKTFEMAFAHSFTGEQNRLAYHRKKLIEKGIKEPTNEQIFDRIEGIAGNQAFEMVKFLHYDYDNWAKARVLQGQAGKVIGQYQHFKFAFFDMQYELIRNMVRSTKALKFTEVDPYNGETILNRDFSRMMRMGSLYSFIPGLIGLVTDFDVGGVMSTFGLALFEEDKRGKGDKSSAAGLIENPIIEEAARLLEYMGNDKDGDLNEQLKHYNAYYGKNPITANLGPFVSDILTAAELTDFLNLTGDEYAEARSLNFDPNDSDWWYNVARIFSVQGSRTLWKSGPAMLKNQWEKAFRIETGAYKPKWITKWREKQLKTYAPKLYSGTVLPEMRYKEKTKTRAQRDLSDEIRRRRALSVINTQFAGR